MTIKRFSSLFSISIIFVLLLSLVFTGNVRADEAPPSTETGEATQPADEETNEEAGSAPTSEPEAGASEPASTPEPGSDPAEEEPTVAEVLEQLPENTEVVIVNEDGSLEPLATEEAVEIVAEADPIWCPSSVATPQDNAGGCSPSFTTMTDLITWLNANDASLTVAGTIWIEKNYDSAAEGVAGFTLDGATFTNFDQHSLTILGAWDGLGTNTFTTSDPSTFTGDFFHILNWNNTVTLKNITVDGAADDGIKVITTGNINLENITSSNNTAGRGAYLDNYSGTGKITLTGTNTFNDNQTNGLYAYSKGDITLNNITANGNLIGDGAALYNSFGTGKITLTGTNTFNDNQGDGLYASSGGDITIENITANRNNTRGARLSTSSSGTYNITLTGTNTFNDNQYTGLQADSKGDITLNNITANGNLTGEGAYLDNYSYGSGTGNITLTGTNTFNDNKIRGLRAFSNGNITIENIAANGNLTYDGAYLNNGSGSGKKITLTGTNTFNDNQGDGLYASSGGDITIENIATNRNNTRGARLSTSSSGTYNITLTGTNTFNDNQYTGLQADSKGDITLNNITANGNLTGDGAYLSNSGGTGKITLTGTNEFNDNGHNGLQAYSKGDITLNNITANGNLIGDGAYLNNSGGTGNITINCGKFNDNTQHGVDATLSGVLTLNGVTFSNNTLGDLNQTGGTLVTNADCNPVGGTGLGKPLVISTLPIREVFTPGGSVVLDCDLYRGTKLILPNGDFAYFPCPLRDSASINPLGSGSLPGDLPEGNNFLSAFNTSLTQDGESKPTISPSGTVSFTIPDGTDASSLAILFWNGSEWVAQSGFINEDAFQSNVNLAGVFVLVSK